MYIVPMLHWNLRLYKVTDQTSLRAIAKTNINQDHYYSDWIDMQSIKKNYNN